ncbi:SAM-dependent methyltransferase [Nocardiopsis baichengensis]|uniref:SAM-dependent methyltransferase n=1 Tax=Nocardiopsis baichengensis TaxID=280240 RepID=UPI0003458683|nr:SAM-dependent methyltransferase [Nocardiopsis baichengensis]
MPETPADPPAPSGVDTTVAHSARVWNYWLGGRDNYPVDRALGDHVIETYPQIVEGARADREFLRRAVTHLAAEEGVRQFLDIGTGLPTHDNTHEVARRAAPDARVVYVDNDPMVVAHARALLVGGGHGATEFVDADLRDVQGVLGAAAELLDFDRPVAVTVLGTMGHIPSYEEARSLVRAYTGALAPGSFLALCDLVMPDGEAEREALRRWNEGAALPYRAHTTEEMAGYFDGLELLEPGVVSATRWRPLPTEVGSVRDVEQYCGVARKP